MTRFSNNVVISESTGKARVEGGGNKLGVCCHADFFQADGSKNREKHLYWKKKQIKGVCFFF